MVWASLIEKEPSSAADEHQRFESLGALVASIWWALKLCLEIDGWLAKKSGSLPLPHLLSRPLLDLLMLLRSSNQRVGSTGKKGHSVVVVLRELPGFQGSNIPYSPHGHICRQRPRQTSGAAAAKNRAAAATTGFGAERTVNCHVSIWFPTAWPQVILKLDG